MASEDGSVSRAEELTGERMEKVHSGYGVGKQDYMATGAAMLAGSAEDKAESGDCSACLGNVLREQSAGQVQVWRN